MLIELRKMGLSVTKQAPITVFYDSQAVGEYYADLLVEEAVIVELKAARAIDEAHQAQLLSYLKATDIEVGLLLNFGPKPDKQRKIYDNELKGRRTRS
jgi:GxxExxY protein